MVTMPVDPELTDQDLGSEIELLADVIDGASEAPSVLSQQQVDSLLGVSPAPTGEERSRSTGEESGATGDGP
ncbi:hypothetical protein [Knoellia sp. p5-6-4]|uniref:hypothetical protein n=1 Tax=unclassified Knoellia TaxID=2618719 RepID=UPI0023DC00E2|nr:hypothetical protein [Knoellia sp. p5-6-4]MDF2143450.1 hypothetical protein [Knoellia sp. p5-6-4]